ncbi:MAG: hypothetical protein U9N13_02380 [Euryarchaeota archaeon]|nr:hypothetical protein [Euryarchaeota archaeon]
MDTRIENILRWLDSQHPDTIKELSSAITAYQCWDHPATLTETLLCSSEEDSWNNSIRDTARTCSALASVGIVLSDASHWIAAQQHTDGSYNRDVYDTVYALIALADMGESNHRGCMWLVENFGQDWNHVGTVSLIVKALLKQDNVREADKHSDLIHKHARWVLSQREDDGGWQYIVTSNIAMQALLLAGYHDELSGSVKWLCRNMNSNGSWGKDGGDVTATAMSLITLGRFERSRIRDSEAL